MTMYNDNNRNESADAVWGLRNELDGLADRLLAIATESRLDETVAVRIREGRAALAGYLPTAMMFGCYNAGKSTLVNALLKRAAADVSDVPCTRSVEAYRFADWTLFDTPGIDAPIEHETITREHLRKCHVVILVVSTAGGTEEERTFSELERLHVAEKEVIVVLNDKTGTALDEAAVLRFHDRVRKALGSLGKPAVPVLLVNAATALRGCEPGKEALYALSGILDLPTELHAALIRAGGMRCLLPGLNLLLDAAVQACNTLAGMSRSADAVRIEEQVKAVRRARAELEGLLEADVKALRGELENRLERDFSDGRSVAETVNWYIGRSETALHRRVAALCAELGADAAGASFSFAADASELRRTASVIPDGESVPDLRGDDLPSGAGSGVDLKQIHRLFQSDGARSAVKDGLLMLRRYGVPGIKGRWERTLGQWAGKLTRGAGVAVQLVLAVKEYRDARRAQAEYEQRCIEARRELRRVACMQAGEIELAVLTQASEAGRQVFEPLERATMEALADLDAAEHRRVIALGRVGVVRARLETVQATVKNL